MRSLSRGLSLLLVLIITFVFVDINGRYSPDSEDGTISEIQEQVAEVAVPVLAVSSQVSALSSSPLPAATPIPVSIPASTVVPTAVRVAEQPINLEADDLKKASRAASESLFDALVTPFAKEAERRRAELAKIDPDHSRRIDKALNDGRVNFLLFGYGETHEPPATEKAIIGSQTIISYDTHTRKADIISLTHDIRAPEIEREFAKRGFNSPAVRIDQAYSVGGFKLMRQTLEDATGLSMDFQITFKDTVMQGLVDSVFGGVEVNVPMAFDVHPFYLDGKKFDKGHFPRGLQRLNGRQVIQFIKTVPISEGAYDKSLEHNVRKALIFDALLDSINRQYRDRLFWLKGSAFVTGELLSGSIAYDFDPLSLIVSNIGTTTSSIRRSMGKQQSEGLGMPKIDKTRYIVDPAHGDGGVQWVSANAAVNPFSQKDIENGVYPSLDVEVPIDSNANGDLITEYWPSVRALVKSTLFGP